MEFLGWLLTILAMLSIAGFVVLRIFFFSQVVSRSGILNELDAALRTRK